MNGPTRVMVSPDGANVYVTAPSSDAILVYTRDPETGLLARLEDDDAIMEIFQAGSLPPMPEAGQGESPDASLEEDPYEIY